MVTIPRVSNYAIPYLILTLHRIQYIVIELVTDKEVFVFINFYTHFDTLTSLNPEMFISRKNLFKFAVFLLE